MRWAMASGIAAALAAGTFVGVSTLTERPVSAAVDVRVVVEASQRFRGWVHITIAPDAGRADWAGADGGRVSWTRHVNTETGAMASVVRSSGRTVQAMFYSPVAREEFRYDARDGTIRVTTVDDRAAGMRRKAVDNFIASIAGGMLQQGGAAVTRSADGTLMRYVLIFPAEGAAPTTAPAAADSRQQHPRKVTIWADRTTHLIRKGDVIETNGRAGHFDTTYGEPPIRDVYDLGVPREAKVVRVGQQQGEGQRPTSEPLRAR